MRKLLLVSLLLSVIALPTFAGGHVFVADQGDETYRFIKWASSTIGITMLDFMAEFPALYIDLGTDPTGQQKVQAIEALLDRGVVYWQQSDLTNQCSNFEAFASMAVQGCGLRGSLVRNVWRESLGYYTLCEDETLILVGMCE